MRYHDFSIGVMGVIAYCRADATDIRWFRIHSSTTELGAEINKIKSSQTDAGKSRAAWSCGKQRRDWKPRVENGDDRHLASNFFPFFPHQPTNRQASLSHGMSSNHPVN
jgi:hypothetical protein